MRILTIFILTFFSVYSLNAQGKYDYLFPEEIDALYPDNPSKAALEYSYIGEHQTANKIYGDVLRSASHLKLKANETYKYIPFLNFLDSIVVNNQIIVINEAHHLVKHRFYLNSILDKLCDNGFDYLALEALCQYEGQACDQKLNTRGYPLNSYQTGVLTREPQFSNLIRTANHAGMNLVSYESTNYDTSQDREYFQAMNISKIFEKDPSAKVIVLCGYDHVIDGNVEETGKSKWMAKHLLEITGINPFTINQTYYTVEVANAIIQEDFSVDKPSVLKGVNGKFVTDNQTDLVLFHSGLTANLQWEIQSDYRSFDFKKLSSSHSLNYPILIHAYIKSEFKEREGEKIKPVPVGIKYVKTVDDLHILSLPIHEEIEIMIVEGNRRKTVRETIATF